jgi:peroxiredoxin
MATHWTLMGALIMAGLLPVWGAMAATLGSAVLSPAVALRHPAPDAPTLAGRTSAGEPISLQALRGQVVLVMVWSTDCPVCLNKMPELRANLAGWQAQGFKVISINTDARPDALRSWEAARQVTVPPLQQWPSLWLHTPGFATSLPLDAPNTTGATHLPSIYVLDRTGIVRLHTTGRVPADVWDTIADLL